MELQDSNFCNKSPVVLCTHHTKSSPLTLQTWAVIFNLWEDRRVFPSKSRPSLSWPWVSQLPPVGRADDSPCAHLSVGFTVAINGASISTLLSSLAILCLQSATSGLLCLGNAPSSPALPHLPPTSCSSWSCSSPPDAFAHPPRGDTTSQSPAFQRYPTWMVKAATGAAHQCLSLRSVLWSWQRVLLVAGFPNWACREEDTAVENLHCYGLGFRAPHSHSFTTGKIPLTH